MTIFYIFIYPARMFFGFFQNWYPYFFLLQINVISRLVSGKALFFSEKNAKDTINHKHHRYTSK